MIGTKRPWLRDAVTGLLIGLYGDGGLVCMLHAPSGLLSSPRVHETQAELTADMGELTTRYMQVIIP